jgi:hypothetical protein
MGCVRGLHWGEYSTACRFNQADEKSLPPDSGPAGAANRNRGRGEESYADWPAGWAVVTGREVGDGSATCQTVTTASISFSPSARATETR